MKGKKGKTLIWENVVSLAYENRVDLSTQALYSTPGLVDSEDQQFYGFTYSAACAEVEIDVLTGETEVLRADICYDIGTSINPAIDIGQVEGAFVMGIGYMLTEEVIFQPDGKSKGTLNTPNTWTYKPPASTTIPIVMNVDLFPRDDASDVPENPNLLMGSKGVGEPPSLYEQGREDTELVKVDGKWLISKRYISSDSGLPDRFDQTFKQRDNPLAPL